MCQLAVVITVYFRASCHRDRVEVLVGCYSVVTSERLVRRGDYIWGSFVKPERVDGYIVGVNPGDKGDILGRFFFSSSSVDEAVNAAARGGAAWRQAGRAERVRAVRAYRDILHHYQDDCAALITRGDRQAVVGGSSRGRSSDSSSGSVD